MKLPGIKSKFELLFLTKYFTTAALIILKLQVIHQKIIKAFVDVAHIFQKGGGKASLSKYSGVI
jgi:hypothetical protein